MSMIDITTNSKIDSGALAFKKFWLIRRAVNLSGTHELKPLGLGMRQAVLILMLNRIGASSQAELSRKAESDPAAAGRAIEVMKKRGWIEQHDHPSDRRRWEIVLTASGKGLAKKIEAIFKRMEEQLCSLLSPKETALFVDLLDKILMAFPDSRTK
jgi:DNA-binding MarR family transcriptional regulator